jgi:hypothetical protein
MWNFDSKNGVQDRAQNAKSRLSDVPPVGAIERRVPDIVFGEKK